MKTTPPIPQLAAICTRLFIATLVCGLISLTAAAQEIISFTVETGVAGTTRNWMFPADLAGAPGVRTNNWNNIGNWVNGGSGNADAALLPGSVTNCAGAAVANMSAVFHNSSGGAYGDRAAGVTNDLKMFMNIADGFPQGTLSGYGYLSLTNIPYSNYNVYVYFLPDNGNGTANTRGGVFCITNAPTGTNCVYMKNQSNDVSSTQLPVPNTTTFATNYIRSTTTSIGSGGVAWSTVDGGNYGVFYGLTNSECKILFAGLGNGSAAKDPFGNYVNGGSTAVRFKVAGFQIYQVPSAAPTNLYLQNTNVTLHAGNPSGTQVTVLSDLSDGTLGVAQTVNCTYSIDNTNIATVNATGLIKAGTNGTANLIATLASAGLALTNPVTVLGPTAVSISVASTNLLLGNGKGDTTTATLNANYTDASNVGVNNYGFVSFGSTPPGVITVTTNGVLTAVGLGTTRVVGSYDGLSVTSGVVTVSAFTAPGSVQALSVNLTDASNPMTFHDLSGAPGGRVAYWNNIAMTYGAVTNEINGPVDYHGNALSNTLVQVLPNNPFNQVTLTLGTRTTNESVMFNTMFDQGANNGSSPQSFVVVSNVPYSSYDAYFYFYNDNSANGTNRPGQVTINGVTQYRINSPSYPNTPANDGSGYVQAVQPGTTPTSVIQVPYGNFIKFSSLTDNVMNVTWGAVGQDVFLDAATVTRARLAGFQLVKSLGGLTATNIYLQSPVPPQLPGNPAGYALTVLADFSDGTMGGNITALPGVTYSSSNTNVFQVDTNGLITPGLTPGVATLTVNYQAKTRNAGVTNQTPTSVQVVAKPGTVYLDGSLGITTAQAGIYANFPNANNVNISSFNGVSYVDQGSPVATMDSFGVITANTLGKADLGASYSGSTWVTTNAFTVTSITNAPALAHRWSFRDAVNSTTVVDTIGGANGTILPSIGAGQNIQLDGDRAIFPGDGTFADCPYISLPPGLLNALGDVTIEMWLGTSNTVTWARAFGAGTTTKGLDPHIFPGGPSTSWQMIPAAPPSNSRFQIRTSTSTVTELNDATLSNGAEHQVVMVCSPNANTMAYYVDGILIGTTTPPALPISTMVNDTVDWLGVSLDNNDPPLNGWISDLRIYEGTFSTNDVFVSYTNGANYGLPALPTTSTTRTNIASSYVGGVLNLSWPSDHLGWTLQVQTNSRAVGLTPATNTWFDIPGTASVTATNFPASVGQPTVFYRLKYFVP